MDSRAEDDRNPTWATFDLAELLSQREEMAEPWLAFLQVSTLSAGLYVLPEGGIDHQDPHDVDELYYIVSGKAMIQVEEDSRQVRPGSLVYVRAHAEHRFHTIEEELKVLVFFSAAEPQ